MRSIESGQNIPVRTFLVPTLVAMLAIGCAHHRPKPPAMTPCRALMLAVDAGDLNLAEQLLNSGADINCRIPKGAHYTPLLWAAANNDPRTARYLVERGADVTAVDAQGRDVESYAASHGEPFDWLVELCRAAKEARQSQPQDVNLR